MPVTIKAVAKHFAQWCKANCETHWPLKFWI